jgi:hypothetical protein
VETHRTNQKGRQLIAAKMIVYSGEDEEYSSFITPEAYFRLETGCGIVKNLVKMGTVQG